VTYAVLPDDGLTRLVARVLVARVLFGPPGDHLGAPLAGRALALGDLVMMRKQLLTLTARNEAHPPNGPLHPLTSDCLRPPTSDCRNPRSAGARDLAAADTTAPPAGRAAIPKAPMVNADQE